MIWNLLNHRASNMQHTELVSSLTTLLHYYVSKHKDRYDHLNGSSFHTANRNLTYFWNSQSEHNWSPLMWKIAALLVFFICHHGSHIHCRNLSACSMEDLQYAWVAVEQELNNAMKRCPSWEDSDFSAGQKMYLNCVEREGPGAFSQQQITCPLPGPAESSSQNPTLLLHDLMQYAVPFHSSFSNWPLPFRTSYHNILSIELLYYECYMPRQFLILINYDRNTYWGGKLRSTSVCNTVQLPLNNRGCDGSVGIITRQWSRMPRICVQIPNNSKRFYSRSSWIGAS